MQLNDALTMSIRYPSAYLLKVGLIAWICLCGHVMAGAVPTAKAGAVPTAKVLPQPDSSRLDTPVTPANSVLVDFGSDLHLRIPKLLINPAQIPKKTGEALKLEGIGMVFQFPEMVETTYPSPMATIFEMQAGRYERHPDHFPVYIKRLFRAEDIRPPNWSRISAPVFAGEDWSPSLSLEATAFNLKAEAKIHHIIDDKITYSTSKYAGLREIHFPDTNPEYTARSEKIWRAHGWDGKHEVAYVEKIGSPYDLLMYCDPVDGQNSTKCDATVFIKKNHLQYNMRFPSESVSHAAELIEKINGMVGGWVQK